MDSEKHEGASHPPGVRGGARGRSGYSGQTSNFSQDDVFLLSQLEAGEEKFRRKRFLGYLPTILSLVAVMGILPAILAVQLATQEKNKAENERVEANLKLALIEENRPIHALQSPNVSRELESLRTEIRVLTAVSQGIEDELKSFEPRIFATDDFDEDRILAQLSLLTSRLSPQPVRITQRTVHVGDSSKPAAIDVLGQKSEDVIEISCDYTRDIGTFEEVASELGPEGYSLAMLEPILSTPGGKCGHLFFSAVFQQDRSFTLDEPTLRDRLE
ncbi:hypothetical protein [uncultured Roseovarius sp.]|uniref:hypothetical protein n=1 Tax=uncultured Roseovarius sp. TaxID=293344 RepID=UPI00260A28EA|nr:hypothetical protein [uncultured Roseovarius sp.]